LFSILSLASSSFPTRRSSDLTTLTDCSDLWRRIRQWTTCDGSLVCLQLLSWSAAPISSHDPNMLATKRPAVSLPQQIPAITVNRDRKSTRLNSSHQIISYAVF